MLVLLASLLLAGRLAAAEEPRAGQVEGGSGPKPYHDLSQAGSDFLGPGRDQPEPHVPETIRVGLIGPGRGVEGVELRRGASLALAQANHRGGFRGRPFELIFRSEDGPWGAAALRVVELAHEDRVWLIVGGLDGHHLHLAELVSVKLWVPVISPWAMDRTVDYSNVPWVFRCPPDDGRQAEALLVHASRQGLHPLLLLREDHREGRVAGERVQEAATRVGLPRPEELVYSAVQPAAALPRVMSRKAAAIIVWGRRKGALALLRAVREAGYDRPLLGPALLAVPEALSVQGLVVAAPFDLSHPSPCYLGFDRIYRSRFGQAPSALAALAYDALGLGIEAIRTAGLNRARIRDALARADFPGATGAIRFNGLGGSLAEPVLLRSRAGGWERVPCTTATPGDAAGAGER